MYPHERSLVKKLAGKPFALIGVNSDRDREGLKDVLEEENITWRSFWNGPEGTRGPISAAWKVRAWPTIYVLDGEGKIRYKNVRGESLDEALEKLLAEAGHEIDLSEMEEDDEDEEGGSDDEDESKEKKDAKSEDDEESEKKDDGDK